MINVEGNYEDIIEYLNANQGSGVRHAYSHRLGYNDPFIENGHKLNFGIFSIVDDERKAAFTSMSFDPVAIKKALLDWDQETEEIRRERNGQ